MKKDKGSKNDKEVLKKKKEGENLKRKKYWGNIWNNWKKEAYFDLKKSTIEIVGGTDKEITGAARRDK